MSISLNFAVLSDANPYVLPVGISAVKSQFKIVSGKLLMNWNDGPVSILRTTAPATGLVEVVFTNNQSSSGDGDGTGAYFGDLSGTGYVARINYDFVVIQAYTEGVWGTILKQAQYTFSPNTTFRATYDTATNEIKIFDQSNPTTAIVSDIVAPAPEVGAGLYIDSSNNSDAGIYNAILYTANAVVAPTYSGNFTASVDENTTVVGTYPVTDNGGGIVTYSLTGDDAGRFSVDSNTGAVAFLASPDFESPTDVGANNVYNINIVGTNSAGNASATITITVTSVVEASLTFTGTGFGSKSSTAYWDDFESHPLGSIGAGTTNTVGSLVVSTSTGVSITNSRAHSGSKSLNIASYATNNFPKPYKPLSGTKDRVYASVRCYLSGDTSLANVYKMWRVGSPAGVEYAGVPRAGESWTAFTSDGFGGEIITLTGNNSSSSHNTASNPSPPYVKDQWLFLELEFYTGTVGNSDARMRALVNGQEVLLWNNRPYLTSGAALPEWLLLPFSGIDGGPNCSVNWDSLYVDESHARVVFTDSATYSSSTKWDVQPITAYSDTSITVLKATPSFVNGSTAHVHLFRDDGSYLYLGTKIVTDSAAVVVAPTFSSNFSVNVAENSTTVGTFAATSTGGEAPVYSLTGADAALFNINASTAAVTFKVAPDFETPSDAGANNVYNFNVVATNSGGSNFATATVTVTDVVEVVTTPGIIFTLRDISTNGRPLVANGTNVTMIVFADGSPDVVQSYTAQVSSNGNVQFTDNSWVAGQTKECVLKVGSIKQTLTFTVIDL